MLPWLLAGLLGAHGWAADAGETDHAPCPPGVTAQIEGLYRWQLARQERPGPLNVSSERQRFTPELYSALQQAAALTPDAGRFIDFDVFSGTQVHTFGAQLLGCSGHSPRQREALVLVRAGLREHSAEAPQRLRFRMEHQADGRWCIADIHYPTDPSFQLSTYLRKLLAPPQTDRQTP